MSRYYQTIYLLILFQFWLTACSTSGPKPVSPSGEIDAAAITAAHNQWRKEVNVPPVMWSTKLEKQAAAWAEQLVEKGCKLRHNRPGQNLFWMKSGTNERFDIPPATIVDYWATEKDWYTASTNRCDAPSGKNCWHYIQMVWRSSRELGCARRYCDTQAQVWVCNYSPAGNLFGQSPFE
jgi:pathogenesis-related protein 1